MGFSTEAEFDQAYNTVQNTFATGATKDKEWRRQQLKRTWWMIEDNKDRICAALFTDLHRHRYETGLSDIAMLQNDILRTLEKLDEWTKDEKPTRWDIINFMGGTRVRKEPKGVALIIGAWNFPFLLLLQPMLAAIAAGCAMILKPSDMAPAAQDLLMEILPQYLDGSAIRCISAGPQEMPHILDQRYDHIFYTGSGNIGKIVHEAAAKHLTTVTLELGGQAPAIVTANANVDLSAKHIAATKFTNAGQICLNVNHVLVDPTVREAFVNSMIQHFDIFMGGRDTKPEYYTHIINDRNFDRLDRLLTSTSGKIVYGGRRDRSTRFFAPTIVTGVKPGDSLLSEELFGPILPVMDADLDSALTYTRSGDRPLGIYAFTEKQAEKTRVLDETQSGGVTFNDCTLHVVACDAPFGGTGPSGQGYYHGPHGVREFSHLRTYVDALPAWMEWLMDARYPPYSVEKLNKLAPAVKPSFDREGNDTSRALTKWVVGLGALVFSVAVVVPRQQVQTLFARLVNRN
ncbi:Aldehyde dehydrogenase NAD(P)-dependent [Penicillium canariense]|uniref:Aldehyde dehydrogenase n=1 Tax=Penicillium canariense TaxID=189055 RepID=A0A9W9I2W0_9EURO|nr:Aldehyde dehydrogenase NAD(P)-dependent [Penicillium canariense]KAJ5166126.1 Aldehyde dehydrogenase NAD(P)-dependent [Penicillium canariense]